MFTYHLNTTVDCFAVGANAERVRESFETFAALLARLHEYRALYLNAPDTTLSRRADGLTLDNLNESRLPEYPIMLFHAITNANRLHSGEVWTEIAIYKRKLTP